MVLAQTAEAYLRGNVQVNKHVVRPYHDAISMLQYLVAAPRLVFQVGEVRNYEQEYAIYRHQPGLPIRVEGLVATP